MQYIIQCDNLSAECIIALLKFLTTAASILKGKSTWELNEWIRMKMNVWYETNDILVKLKQWDKEHVTWNAILISCVY